MERALLLSCMLVLAQAYNELLHSIVKREYADDDGDITDLIDFTPQCTMAFSKVSPECMNNMLALMDAYKVVETEVASEWAEQCSGNIYDCVTSPDQETKKILKFFEALLPKIKDLCKDGCMLPIIDLIHSCLKPNALANIGVSRTEMEDIFDLVCIQAGPHSNGTEGEYCMIKAMTTVSYLIEANTIRFCRMDDLKMDQCGTNCTCTDNCTLLITEASTLMGCCMGTLLELEDRFNLTHPNNDDILNPGSKMFDACNVATEPSCKTSKAIIDEQEDQYLECYNALVHNSESECIDLEDQAHDEYLANMQNISRTCQETKNIGLCKSNTSRIVIDNDLRSLLTKLNQHCGKCAAELAGIRDNCTVFLPNEAKMVFQLMCMKNSNGQHCGPKIIEYEAKRGRVDLDSNPCFKGFMHMKHMQCSKECKEEVYIMNKYGILNCIDALVYYTHTPVLEWSLWHELCVKDKVDVVNKLNMSEIVSQKADNWKPGQDKTDNKDIIVKTVGYTFIGTIMLSLLIAGIVFTVYKRHRFLSMFGYNKFHGDDHLITDVQMDDGVDDGENVYNDF